MCGRFGLFDGIDDLAWHFNVSAEELAGYAPRWNIAPAMSILAAGKENAVGVVRWGILVSRGNRPLFNARSETLHHLPAFRGAFQQGAAWYPPADSASGASRPAAAKLRCGRITPTGSPSLLPGSSATTAGANLPPQSSPRSPTR